MTTPSWPHDRRQRGDCHRCRRDVPGLFRHFCGFGCRYLAAAHASARAPLRQQFQWIRDDRLRRAVGRTGRDHMAQRRRARGPKRSPAGDASAAGRQSPGRGRTCRHHSGPRQPEPHARAYSGRRAVLARVLGPAGTVRRRTVRARRHGHPRPVDHRRKHRQPVSCACGRANARHRHPAVARGRHRTADQAVADGERHPGDHRRIAPESLLARGSATSLRDRCWEHRVSCRHCLPATAAFFRSRSASLSLPGSCLVSPPRFARSRWAGGQGSRPTSARPWGRYR